MSKALFSFLCLLACATQAIDNQLIEKKEWLSLIIENFDCHSSSIIETDPGKYCAVWKGGPGKGQSNKDISRNVGIWISLFDGMSWTDPKELISAPQSISWSPVLCKTIEGELLLFYRIGPEPRRTVSFLKRSFDGGVNWSKEEMLPAGIVGPTKNKPYVTSSGTLISPSSVEAGAPEDQYRATACWVEISKDNGHHWKKIGPLELQDRKFGVIEPTFFHDSQGNLRMLCRDRANRIDEKGYIWMAISENEGLDWSEFKQTALPNPDSAIDVVDLGEGKLILFYNHSHTDRFPLNMALSNDGGDTWSDPFVIDDRGEFPSAALGSDGSVHVTYAVGSEQRRIRHIVINPKQL